MKTINLDIVNEKIYYEKLDNGLEVYLIRKKNFNSSYACFNTNFGGLDTIFMVEGEKKFTKVPSGVAHFLEHKLFEQKDGETVHDFYKKSGTYVNAFTNYKSTKYIFNGPNNFKENLNYLLDFVQSPYFTNENVEKERGIILEEAFMGLDNPDRKFHYTLMHNLFNSLLYNNTVIGSIEDIKKITKEDLYKCYNAFYHPSNMALFIVTNEEVKEIFDLIKNNQSKKHFKKDFKITRKEIIEEEKVRVEKEIIKDNVFENRMCYAIKMKLKDFKASKLEVYDYFSIFFGIVLGNLSEFNLELKEKEIIKDNIAFGISSDEDKNDTFIIFKIYSITDKYDEFTKLLEDKLLSKDYSEEDFNLYKKSFISDLNYSFNSVNGVMNFMKGEYDFFKTISNDSIEKEMNLNYKKFKEVTDKLSLENKTILIMEKK